MSAMIPVDGLSKRSIHPINTFITQSSSSSSLSGLTRANEKRRRERTDIVFELDVRPRDALLFIFFLLKQKRKSDK